MRIEGRRYRDEWLPNYYPAKKIAGKCVRLSRAGSAIVLTEDENDQIDEFFMEEDLFARLERSGHIISRENATAVFDGLSTWLKGTYDGPGLHIIVPTRRCNLNCTYCHMYPQPVGSSKSEMDLDPSLIPHIARFIMSTPRKEMTVEFQGGEPFLNFTAVAGIVEEIKRLNSTGSKEIKFAIVTNLMVASDEQLQYCQEQGIRVSYSLNGPEAMHDLFRVTRSGGGSHTFVMRRMREINGRFPGLLAKYPLCVITEDNMAQLIEMAEYYFDLGFCELGLIHLKNLGNARGHVRFDMRKFIPHYIELLEHLYRKNAASSEWYSERWVHFALTKIVSSRNPLFVDWRNPIGYLSNCIVYDADGSLLPVDEARSFKEVFSLGNVRNTTYEGLIQRRSAFNTVNLSIRDRDSVCRECTYNPYCGVSPVLHYSKTGSCTPEPYVSDECIFVLAIFDWIFKKFIEADPVPLLKMAPRVIAASVRRVHDGVANQEVSKSVAGASPSQV